MTIVAKRSRLLISLELGRFETRSIVTLCENRKSSNSWIISKIRDPVEFSCIMRVKPLSKHLYINEILIFNQLNNLIHRNLKTRAISILFQQNYRRCHRGFDLIIRLFVNWKPLCLHFTPRM